MASLLSALFMVLTVLTSGHTVDILIDKMLDEGKPIVPTTNQATVSITYNGFKENLNDVVVKVTLSSSLTKLNPVVNVYLANDQKNILEISITSSSAKGTYYPTPHSKRSVVLGEIQVPPSPFSGADLSIPDSWFRSLPSVNSSSASLEFTDEFGMPMIYNYYGIKNYKISIPDKMVVEQYKKF